MKIPRKPTIRPINRQNGPAVHLPAVRPTQVRRAARQSPLCVGKEFASEARKIHYQEAPTRTIRGQATSVEFDALREEGVEVVQLPVLNKDELN